MELLKSVSEKMAQSVALKQLSVVNKVDTLFMCWPAAPR